MHKIFKMVLGVLLVVTVLSIALAVLAFIGKEKEYKKRILTEEKLAVALKEKRKLQDDLDLSEKAKQSAETKIVELEGEITGFTAEIETLKKENSAMSDDLTAKANEIVKLKGDLKKVEWENRSISSQMQELRANFAAIEKDITNVRNEKTKLEQKLNKFRKDTVELEKIVVGPSENSTLQAPAHSSIEDEPLKGDIVLVNRDYNFVVTNLSKNDGVTKGMVFDIKDGNESLGKAEINKVYDTMSSATLLPNSNIAKIKKGNIIIESR